MSRGSRFDKLRVSEAQSLERARAEVLDEDVGFRDQRVEQRRGRRAVLKSIATLSLLRLMLR